MEHLKNLKNVCVTLHFLKIVKQFLKLFLKYLKWYKVLQFFGDTLYIEQG